MKTLPVVWKCLVSKGEACPRCGSTQKNVADAVAQLESALQPLGIRLVLETRAIDAATFRADPAQSNHIRIGGRPMEEWLGARAGSSPCCEVCGDLPCRTTEVDGRSYEAIPQELIVKAAVIAASRMIGPETAAPAAPCCTKSCGCG
ncbi:MAG: DUF2703 domain-containing protein [Proteobacteria bacterium]|jgi:hypothetical protein|nr:DUF2703 domain-containing protein [Pseudomonadota bacterium]